VERSVPELTIVSIAKLVNPKLSEAYTACVKEMQYEMPQDEDGLLVDARAVTSLDHPMNEYMLWHGVLVRPERRNARHGRRAHVISPMPMHTGSANAVLNEIAEYGCNTNYSSPKSLFGKGVYFSPYASKSDIYTQRPHLHTTRSKIFYCRVAMGNFKARAWTHVMSQTRATPRVTCPRPFSALTRRLCVSSCGTRRSRRARWTLSLGRPWSSTSSALSSAHTKSFRSTR
jgi:hypothetical protein